MRLLRPSLVVFSALLLVLARAQGDEVEPEPEPEQPDEHDDDVIQVSNVDYVGRGYDILRGNPRPDGGKADPGWQDAVFVQDFTNSRVSVIGGDRVEVPEDYEILSAKNCLVSMTATSAMNASAWTENLAAGVSASGKGGFGAFKASFKASASYKSSSDKFEESNTQIIESKAECATYQISVTDNHSPRLSSGFRNAVTNLPSEYEENSYYAFIDDFGTHYSRRVTLGAIAGTRIFIEETKVRELESMEIDVSLQASASAGRFASGSVSADFDYDSSEKNELEDSLDDQLLFAYGATFIGPEITEGDAAEEWYQAAKNDGLPLQFELEVISSLLTREAFPDVPSIRQKRVNLATALMFYCSELESDGEIDCSDIEFDLTQTEKVGGDQDDPERWEIWSEELEWRDAGRPMLNRIAAHFDEQGYVEAVSTSYENDLRFDHSTCVDRRGHFRSGEILDDNRGRSVKSWTACQSRCTADARCVAWIWRSAEHKQIPETCVLISSLNDDTLALNDEHVVCNGRECQDCGGQRGNSETLALGPRSTNTAPEQITSVEVCLRNSTNVFGNHADRITSMTFETNRPGSPKVFKGESRGYFEFVEGYLTSREARQACAAIGGGLPSIATAAEMNDLRAFAQPFIDAREAPSIRKNIWLGATDALGEGGFEWNDGTTWAFTNWRTGEPNNLNGEDCVEMFIDDPKSPQPEWNDIFCTDARFVVCEIPFETTCTKYEFPQRLGLLFLSGTGDAFIDSLTFHSYDALLVPTEALTLEDFGAPLDGEDEDAATRPSSGVSLFVASLTAAVAMLAPAAL